MAITFNGPDLEIEVTTVGTYDVQVDLYSDWKEWVKLSDNAKYPQAFDTTGGDPVTGGQAISPYFFLRNDLGWKVVLPNANGTVVLNGNLYPRDNDLAEVMEIYIPGGAGNTVVVELNVSPQSITTTDDAIARIEKFLRNRQVTNRTSGKLEQYADDGLSIEYEADLFEDESGTTAYSGNAIIRRNRMEAP